MTDTDIRLLTLTSRRNSPRTDGVPSIYAACVQVLNNLGDHSLARHEFNRTFTRTTEHDENQDKSFMSYVNLKNDKIFTAHLIAEVAPEAAGTWVGGYQKNALPQNLPLSDSSNAHRMVIAARCPTGAPTELEEAFKGCIGAVEEIYFQDKDEDDAGPIKFKVTPWACRADGNNQMAFDTLVLKLEPTYERRSRKTVDASASRPKNRESTSAPPNDTQMEAPAAERKIGDTYEPDMLSEHRGPYFAHSSDIKLVQRDHRTADDRLIAPYEFHKELTEGTLFSAQITLHTYIFRSNPTSNKVYHIYVEKLKVLDHGYGAPWKIPIPSLPSAGPSSPKKRKGADRDDTANDAFEAFSSISPKKKL
ncbi:hypothetical protein MSAN_00442900 [Mycena sanguinolenta]|uniref:Uncharacterized protein n=1 Tax=Mycena sanguinolenta TaxID=230812 RepID=A0A8H6ZDT3_9AGAR|nr:hypothetical protein MSAN_00442900 [Mycena sanguinolenta]